MGEEARRLPRALAEGVEVVDWAEVDERRDLCGSESVRWSTVAGVRYASGREGGPSQSRLRVVLALVPLSFVWLARSLKSGCRDTVNERRLTSWLG